MKKTKFTEEQIAFTLRQAEAGTPVAEVIRNMRGQRTDVLSLEEAIRRDGRRGAASPEAARGREPEVEAAGGGPVTRQGDATGRHPLKAVKPGRRRELVRHLRAQYRVSERRGCAVLRSDRSSHRYYTHASSLTPLLFDGRLFVACGRHFVRSSRRMSCRAEASGSNLTLGALV